MTESEWGFRAKPFEGKVTGSPTATDWAGPVGTPINQIPAGTIKRASLLKTDHIPLLTSIEAKEKAKRLWEEAYRKMK